MYIDKRKIINNMVYVEFVKEIVKFVKQNEKDYYVKLNYNKLEEMVILVDFII